MQSLVKHYIHHHLVYTPINYEVRLQWKGFCALSAYFMKGVANWDCNPWVFFSSKFSFLSLLYMFLAVCPPFPKRILSTIIVVVATCNHFSTCNLICLHTVTWHYYIWMSFKSTAALAPLCIGIIYLRYLQTSFS